MSRKTTTICRYNIFIQFREEYLNLNFYIIKNCFLFLIKFFKSGLFLSVNNFPSHDMNSRFFETVFWYCFWHNYDVFVLIGKILSALLNGVKNANAGVIKQAYSSAIGSVIKVKRCCNIYSIVRLSIFYLGRIIKKGLLE